MTNATIRTAVQAAQAAINGAKSRGPTSAIGKERSALNSVRYGFSGAHLLLPGEDAVEYERYLDRYFAELVPTSMPEAVIVAQFADLNWRLERLTRVENNRHRARLEEELEKTDTYKTTACTRHALELVDAIALTVEAVPIPPQDAAPMGSILVGVERIVGFLGEVPELPQAVVQPLSQALDAAKKSLSKDRVKKDEYEALGNTAKMVRGALREKLAREEAALLPLRECLAAEVLLLEDADLKKLERHRRLLENSMQRQLALLAQVRALVTTARPEAQAEAKELRVKLRVVK